MKAFLSLFAINQILMLLLGLLFLRFGEGLDFKSYSAATEARFLIGGMLVMPFLETVFFQFMIIEGFVFVQNKIFNNMDEKYFLYVGAVCSAIIFFLVHYIQNGSFSGYIAGVPGGITLAIAYVHFRKTKAEAFAATWLLHTLNNVYSLSLTIMFYKLIGG